MTIAPVLNIDREKWVLWESSWLLMILFMYASVLYIPLFWKVTQHAFVYDSHFQQKRRVNTVVQSLIIYHMHTYVYCSKEIEKQSCTEEYA